MKRAIAVFCSIVALVTISINALAALPITLDDIRKVMPGASSHTHRLEPVDHYLVKDEKGTVIGIAFLTSAVPPPVRGYRDELDILTGMDTSGTITGVTILSHQEDPEYIGKLTAAGFLKKFVGRSVDRGFDDIEAVTGATISSNTIKKDIQTAAFEVHRKLIDSGIIRKEAGTTMRPFDALAAAAVVVLMAGAVAAVLMPRQRWLRYALWIASFAAVGIWLNAPITVGTFVDLRNGTLPPHLPLLLLLFFAVIASLVKGNLYCAYMCPFGALQEGASRLRFPKCRPADSAEKNAGWLRWIILIASVFAIAIGVQSFRTIEPFALLFSRTRMFVVYIHAGVVIAVALFIRRPWCKYFCPTGAVLDLLSQLGGKVRHWKRQRGVAHEHEAS